MAYEVLARKWRPRQFDDVVGQSHVTQTLKNAINSKRIAHAYLFVGPRGIGKTSLARIFSKALNCVNGPTAEPCDKCDSCREITAGNSLDVLEIDGASNNGVDQVRELRETVKYAPTHGTYKIYIIDEVHMLSTAAFNALLKTLEEPPPHVKFIFATTEPEKILPTILSRCQRFDLRRIPVTLIVDRLKLIAVSEKIKVEPDALFAVARGCEGGLRDAVSAMDQLVSFKGTDIKEDDVLSVFGLASRALLEDMADRMLQGDMKAVIVLVGALDESGKDMQRFVLELMGHFRNLLVWMHVKDASGMEIIEAQVETLKRQAAGTSSERVLRIADILGETENRMKYTLSKRTLLETALIRCSRAATVVSIEDILRQINALRAGMPEGEVQSLKGTSDSGRVSVVAQGAVSEKSQSTEMQSGRGSGAHGGRGFEEPGRMSVKETGESAYRPAPSSAAPLMSGIGDELVMLKESWHDIVDKVGKMAVGTKSLLLDARPIGVDSGTVKIGFDPEFADEIERFDVPRNRKAIEHVISAMLKRTVSAVLTVSDVIAQERAAGAVPEAKHRPAVPAGNAPALKGQPKTKRDLIDDPAVQKALDVFDGTILDVRE